MHSAEYLSGSIDWFYKSVEENNYSKSIAWTASCVFWKTIRVSTIKNLEDPFNALDFGWKDKIKYLPPTKRSKHPFPVACLFIAFKLETQLHDRDRELIRNVLFTSPWCALASAELKILEILDFEVYFKCPFFIISELAKSQRLRAENVEHAEKCIKILSSSNTLTDPVDPFCVAIAALVHFKNRDNYDQQKITQDALLLADCLEDWNWENRLSCIDQVMEIFNKIFGLSDVNHSLFTPSTSGKRKRTSLLCPSTQKIENKKTRSLQLPEVEHLEFDVVNTPV